MKKFQEFFSDESGAIPVVYGLAVALTIAVVLTVMAFWGTDAAGSGGIGGR
jgi:Flp pilus assembly pilin Flp